MRKSKPIDVLFLAWDDNSNTLFRFWQCAQHLGLNSVMFKGRRHPFAYPVQAPIHPSLASTPIAPAPVTVMAPGIESLLQSAHVVHLGASTYPMAAVDWRKLNVVVQHGGTVYRQYADACNRVFNQIAGHAIIQCPDLLGMGARNESWIYYPVDTDQLTPDFAPKKDRLVIGHFPSNSEVKGTDTIERVLSKLYHRPGLEFEYHIDRDALPWKGHLKRLSECDIIIEGCNEKQGERVYGEWGNNTLEASALGCGVVTHCVHLDLYEKEFGAFGPLVANNALELEKTLLKVLSMTAEQIVAFKQRCRLWAEKKHSIAATAERLWELVYRNYFE